VDPHCFDADPDPAQNLDVDPDPDPDPDRGGGEGGAGQPNMCIPPGKILGTPLATWRLMTMKLIRRHYFQAWHAVLLVESDL
jgi:hypothetical protein